MSQAVIYVDTSKSISLDMGLLVSEFNTRHILYNSYTELYKKPHKETKQMS